MANSKKVDILIIGPDGRADAFAWACRKSPLAKRIFVAPGNGGTGLHEGIKNVPISSDDIPALVAFAHEQHIDLTIVSPEAPLVAGVVDAFTKAGLPIFGPSQAAAMLEGSKVLAKQFMSRWDIPTAPFRIFNNYDEACLYIREHGAPIVVKADGLAAGKGVMVCKTVNEGIHAAHRILIDKEFGEEACGWIVIEDFLPGEEASCIAMVDTAGNIKLLAGSQDHKTRDEGDEGPNTGGMGAYSPAPVLTEEMQEVVLRTILRPTVDRLRDEHCPFVGFLYVGLMIVDGVPRVLEYNVRAGDPEIQPILVRLKSDLVAHILAALDGTLDGEVLEWDPRAAVGIVVAAQGYGYPSGPVKDDRILGWQDIADDPKTEVFFAGVRESGGVLYSNGGRLLCIVGLGDTVTDAQRKALEGVSRIYLRGKQFRRDIGYRAIAREELAA